MLPPLFSSQPLPPSPAVRAVIEMEGGKDHGGKGASAHSQAIKEFVHGALLLLNAFPVVRQT
jgi:hypothetical protein